MFLRPLARAAAVALLVLSAAAGPVPASHAQAIDGDPQVVEGPTSPLSITTKTGVYPFEVEVADTPDTRALGLMYRRSLAPDRGMLFDMGGVGEATFWMENTYVSLDIAFVGADGRVVSVATDTIPRSRALIPSGGPVRWVLELAAGTARRIALAPGDRVAHDLLPR